MPFCSQCGTPVEARDVFCAKCGARQPVSGAGASQKEILDAFPPRTAKLLCYIPVVGWVMSIVVLASQRFREDRETRFHAFQGLYLFVVYLMVDWVLGPMFRSFGSGFRVMPVGSILKAAVFAGWIFMLIKASHNETYKLPFIGELAERSVAEQR